MGAKSYSGLVGLMLSDALVAKKVSTTLHHYDLVRTIVAVETEGCVIQSGSLGTVVDISPTSDACEIEFTEPMCCVLTMTRDQFVRA